MHHLSVATGPYIPKIKDLVAPHPLMGKLTVRDILFFTLYHNLHHVRDVQQLLGWPQTEWFEPLSLGP